MVVEVAVLSRVGLGRAELYMDKRSDRERRSD
jgi:hypothetical protein